MVPAVRRPLHGARQVATAIAGFARISTDDHVLRPGEINGMPGFVVWYGNKVDSVWTLQIADDHVAAIHVVRNPAKLNTVGHRHP
jgi:RNA polymerase sigma-70 factor (ECF subfamily)